MKFLSIFWITFLSGGQFFKLTIGLWCSWLYSVIWLLLKKILAKLVMGFLCFPAQPLSCMGILPGTLCNAGQGRWRGSTAGFALGKRAGCPDCGTFQMPEWEHSGDNPCSELQDGRGSAGQTGANCFTYRTSINPFPLPLLTLSTTGPANTGPRVPRDSHKQAGSPTLPAHSGL